MKQSVLRQWPQQGAELCRLVPHEMIDMDAGQVIGLYAELGEAAAETVVCRVLEELAVILADLQRLVAEARLEQAVPRARMLQRIAGQIGMVSLARVAHDLGGCAAQGERVAAQAVMARLLRIGDRSLARIWDIQDGPGWGGMQ